MSTVQPDAPSFEEKLAAELRVKIYEYAMKFDNPLKRVGPSNSSEKTEKDSTANTSALLTSKKAYNEALPVLYKENTIVLTHEDICTRGGRKPNRDLDLVHDLVLKDGPDSEPWTRCKECSSESFLLRKLFTACPKLRTARIMHDDRYKSPRLAKRDLVAAGFVTKYTNVGQFEIVNAPSSAKVSFEFTALTTLWDHVMGLNKDDFLHILIVCEANSESWAYNDYPKLIVPLGRDLARAVVHVAYWHRFHSRGELRELPGLAQAPELNESDLMLPETGVKEALPEAFTLVILEHQDRFS